MFKSSGFGGFFSNPCGSMAMGGDGTRLDTAKGILSTLANKLRGIPKSRGYRNPMGDIVASPPLKFQSSRF